MIKTIRKTKKTTGTQSTKSAILKKLNRSTREVSNSTILPLLKKKGALELTLTELRKRLSTMKTPLSQEIIAERKAL